MKDLYEILGIDRNADEKEIKKAFKKAAFRTHPDRQQGKSEEEKKKAEEEFKEISRAYNILSDPDKKLKYDQLGIIDDGTTTSGGPAGFDPFEQFAEFFRNNGFDRGNPFSGRQRNPEYEPGTHIQMRVKLSFEDIYNGCTKKVKYSRNVRCHTCHGTGGEGKEQCKYCHGTGMFTQTQYTAFGYSSTSSPCPYCNATGYMVKHPCKDCNGTGFEKEEKVITVKFPPGVMNNNGILFNGEGNEAPNEKGKNGNFIAVAQWDFNDEKFYIQGYDVYEKIKVPWNICIAGGQYEFTFPDGEVKYITIHECTQPESHLRIKGRGIANKGDYYLIIEYLIPNKLSKKEKDILSKL